jgi:hypothetical protein
VSGWVIRVDFGVSASCLVKGVIAEMPVVRFCRLKGIGLDMIQLLEPEPRIMRYELTEFEWADNWLCPMLAGAQPQISVAGSSGI